MMDKAIDEIRDMVGAVPKTDMYTNPSITLIKKIDKKKYIFSGDCKDLTQSKVPENIEVLYDGKTKLIELTIPDPLPLEMELNRIFKDKKYKTAIERKKEIRKAIYIYIFGPHALASDNEYVKGFIDKIYEIKIKSVFTKGRKRLRNMAIKEIEMQNPDYFKNKRISRIGYQVTVHPLEHLGKEANIYEEMSNELSEINEENFDSEFLAAVKILKNKINERTIKPEYKYYDMRKEMHSHIAESLKSEIEQEIEQIKKWEQDQMSEILKAKEQNLEILEEFKIELKKMVRTYDASKTFKTVFSETSSSKIIEIKDYNDIHKILGIAYKWDGARDNIIITYPKNFKYKEYAANTGYNEDATRVVKKVGYADRYYNLYYANSWKSSFKLYLFIEKIEDGNNRKYEIWLADGIWKAMDKEDFCNMKQFFDEDMKLLKEIKTRG